MLPAASASTISRAVGYQLCAERGQPGSANPNEGFIAQSTEIPGCHQQMSQKTPWRPDLRMDPATQPVSFEDGDR